MSWRETFCSHTEQPEIKTLCTQTDADDPVGKAWSSDPSRLHLIHVFPMTGQEILINLKYYTSLGMYESGLQLVSMQLNDDSSSQSILADARSALKHILSPTALEYVKQDTEEKS